MLKMFLLKIMIITIFKKKIQLNNYYFFGISFEKIFRMQAIHIQEHEVHDFESSLNSLKS